MTYKTPPDDPATETWTPDLPPETGGPRARPHDGGKPVIDSWKYDKADLSQSVTVKREQGKGTRPWREPAGVEGPFLPLDHDVLDVHSPVVIVEGERARDAIQASGVRYPVTCWISGAQNWAQTDWSILANSRIILWPDRDQVGFDAMEALAEHLSELGADVWAADIPETEDGEPDGWDAADCEPGQIEGILDGAYQMESTEPKPSVVQLPTIKSDVPRDPSETFQDWQPIPGWMECGAVAIWHGAPKGGKSAFGLLAGAQLLSGRNLTGIADEDAHNPADRRGHQLLMVWLEESETTVERRRLALAEHHNLDPNIWKNSHSIYELDRGPNGDDYSGLAWAVDQIKPSVIMVDTLAMLDPNAEGAAVSATLFMAHMKTLARKNNSAVVVLHHDRKMPGQDGGKASGDEMSRGSSALIGSARVMVQIEDKDGQTVVTGGGTNNARSAETKFFNRVSVDVNGREVVAFEVAKPPDAFEGIDRQTEKGAWRAVGKAALEDRRHDIRSTGWAGYVVADALELDVGRNEKASERDPDQTANRKRVEGILAAWVRMKALAVKEVEYHDEKARKDKKHTFYEFGKSSLHGDD